MTAASLHLKLGGMHCSLCVTSVERALRRLPGVEQVHVSIAHEEVLVRYDPQRVTPGEIRRTLEALGFAPREPDEAARLAAEERELAQARRKALQAGILLLLTSGLMLAGHVSGPSPAGMLAMAGASAFTRRPDRPDLSSSATAGNPCAGGFSTRMCSSRPRPWPASPGALPAF